MSPQEFENIVPELRQLIDFFGNQTDAEDVAQEGLIRLWNFCERLDARRNMEALAIRVAKNVCVETFRKRSNNTITLDDRLEDNTTADANLDAEDTQHKIDEAIERLSPREQELFRKRHIEGHTAEEITNETGIPKPSVKSIISMAKRKLIKDLQKILK